MSHPSPQRIEIQAVLTRSAAVGVCLTVTWALALPRFLLLDTVAEAAATQTGLLVGLATTLITAGLLTLRLRHNTRAHLPFRAAIDLTLVASALALLRWYLNQIGSAVPYVESFSILLLDIATAWVASLSLYVVLRRWLRRRPGITQVRGLPSIRTVFWIAALVLGGFAAAVLGVGSAARAAGALNGQQRQSLKALIEMMGTALDAAQTEDERLQIVHLLDVELYTEAQLLPEGDRPEGLNLELKTRPTEPILVSHQDTRTHWIARATPSGVLWLSTPANIRPPIQAPNDAPALLILTLLVLGAPLAAWWVGQDLGEELRDVTEALDAMADGDQGESRSVPLTTNDEVGDVVTELNAVWTRYITQNEVLSADLDAAETSDRSRGRFLASASHELRTPLNTIAGFCYLLTSDTSLTEGQRENVQTINESAEQLLTHVHEILGLSEMDPTDVERWRAVPLDGLIHNIIKRAEIPEQIQISVITLPNTPPAWGDERRLGQILQNLISNALKFTEQGAVRIRLAPSSMEGTPAVMITVQDSGCGIPAEELDAIFTEFHRVEAQRKIAGTGLGLSIARQLTEQHRGTLQVRSELGVGSVFTLTLPTGPR